MITNLPAADDPLIAELQRDEGYATRLSDGGCQAYPDPLSPLAVEQRKPLAKRKKGWVLFSGAPWTIAFGHTGPEVHDGLVWTYQQGYAALLRDIAVHDQLLATAAPWVAGLDVVRRDVLRNMVFNMGWDNPKTPAHEGLSGFVNTLAAIRGGRYDVAANGMAASKWAAQTGDRASRLIKMMRTGTR